MKRFARAPLLVQVLGLVAAVAVMAQLTSLAALLVMPSPREPFVFADIASALQSGKPVVREGQELLVWTVDSPPEEWALDDEQERSARATLAGLVGLPYERVRAETHLPFPGGSLVARIASPPVTGPAPPPQPYDQGGEVTFYDMIAAAQRPDGRWTVVRTPVYWGAAIAFLAVWLAAGLLVLLPLA